MNVDFWRCLQVVHLDISLIAQEAPFCFTHHPNFAISDLWRHLELPEWKNLAPPWSPLRRFPPGKPAPRAISHCLEADNWIYPEAQGERINLRTTAIGTERDLQSKIMLTWKKAGEYGLGNGGNFVPFGVILRKVTWVSAKAVLARAEQIGQTGKCLLLAKTPISLKQGGALTHPSDAALWIRAMVQRNVALWGLWGQYPLLPDQDIVAEFSMRHCTEVQGITHITVRDSQPVTLQRPSRDAFERDRLAALPKGKSPKATSGLIDLTGWLGKFELEPLSPELAFHLALAEQWGIGSNTLYGFGHMAITPLP